MSRRMTRSQTIFLENPVNHFKHLIKNPKICTSTKSKTIPVKRKIEDSTLDDASKIHAESNNDIVPVKYEESSRNGIVDSLLIDQLALDKPITSSQPIEHSSQFFEEVVRIGRNTTSEAIVMGPSDIALPIESISNKDQSIQTVVERSHQDASVNSQPTVSGQNTPICLRRKTVGRADIGMFSTSTPILPERRSERLKKSTSIYVQPKKTASKKTAVPIDVHSLPVEASNANVNVPSSSTETISHRRKTQTDRRKKPVEDEISRMKLNSNDGKITIPTELKEFLINDAIIIKRQRKCYKIPATQNVAKIIDDYLALKQPTENQNEISFNQLFGSIIAYFDRLLSNQLLYEPERQQHLDVMNKFPGENVSKLYTPIYLLRLLVQLDSLIGFSKRDKGSLQSAVNYLNEFAKYLAENKSVFSDMNYFS